MSNKVVLTATYYDPDGRLLTPIRDALPVLLSIFDQLSISASGLSFQPTIDLFKENGVIVDQRPEVAWEGLPPIGLYRRTAVAQALQQNPTHLILCDLDRAAHWANAYPDELAHVVSQLPERDFWVYGRTERAFHSHPPSMVRTESIINDMFAQISGQSWDVLAAARGMSAEVAQFIVENSKDDTFGNDPSWPLLVLKDGRFSTGYLATEGMEFETADAFSEEVAAAGGVENWLSQQEKDPKRWLFRLKAATVEVEAMLPFLKDSFDDC